MISFAFVRAVVVIQSGLFGSGVVLLGLVRVRSRLTDQVSSGDVMSCFTRDISGEKLFYSA